MLRSFVAMYEQSQRINKVWNVRLIYRQHALLITIPLVFSSAFGQAMVHEVVLHALADYHLNYQRPK